MKLEIFIKSKAIYFWHCSLSPLHLNPTRQYGRMHFLMICSSHLTFIHWERGQGRALFAAAIFLSSISGAAWKGHRFGLPIFILQCTHFLFLECFQDLFLMYKSFIWYCLHFNPCIKWFFNIFSSMTTYKDQRIGFSLVRWSLYPR